MVRKAEKTARKKAGIPKPYNSGQWTEARYHSFVKGALRAASRRWPPKYEALRRACVGKRHDPATGKQSFRYTCAGCANIFKAAEISVDHLDPVVCPDTGFVDWGVYIARLFCEVDNLQVLCTECHGIKTQNEKRRRSAAR